MKTENDWIVWNGGDCPVPDKTIVDVTLRNGKWMTQHALDFKWKFATINDDVVWSSDDIVRYRIASTSAMTKQEGGDHYKKLVIQPMEYSMRNGLDACQHTIIKYVTRFRDKGGVEDLRKAIHCIEMLIEFEQKTTS